MKLDPGTLEEELKRLQEEEARRLRERQEARAQEVRRIIADPDLMALLRKLILIEEGHAVESPKTPHQIELSRRVGAIYRERDEHERGSQTLAVRRIIASLHGPITTSQIGDAVRACNMPITNIAVGKILRRLQGAEELRVAQRGAGSEPNVYEKTESFKP
jgi:hypothetical protein